MNQHYDIIGDIHGHAATLKKLLYKLGYQSKRGVYSHPEGRKVVFLGDFLDRGPEILEVLRIARGMVDAGTALAILGNHEVNALRYHTTGPDNQPLRSHNADKKGQHQATLDQLADPHPAEWCQWMRWLSRLPLSLDLGGLRVVHAAWDDVAVAEMKTVKCLEGKMLAAYSLKNSPAHDTISKLINGPEAILPQGVSFSAADRTRRNEIRVKWWLDLNGATYREAVFPASDDIPDIKMPTSDCREYPMDAPPVFFGHYAIRDNAPKPLRHNVACLDYGMGKGGFLCAYRWEGEQEIREEKFITARIRENE